MSFQIRVGLYKGCTILFTEVYTSPPLSKVFEPSTTVMPVSFKLLNTNYKSVVHIEIAKYNINFTIAQIFTVAQVLLKETNLFNIP